MDSYIVGGCQRGGGHQEREGLVGGVGKGHVEEVLPEPSLEGQKVFTKWWGVGTFETEGLLQRVGGWQVRVGSWGCRKWE